MNGWLQSCKPGIQKARSQYHHCLAHALLQLQFNSFELASNNAHHTIDFFGSNGSRPTLLSQQIYHMRWKFIAGLQQ